MNGKIIHQSRDMDEYLTDQDRNNIDYLDGLYRKAMRLFKDLETLKSQPFTPLKDDAPVIGLYEEIGKFMQKIISDEDRIHVYSFETHSNRHGEASRLIAKLRDCGTAHHEFVYYLQRSYELLFDLAWGCYDQNRKNHFIVKTPVDYPVQNYAVHKIPDIDEVINNTVMCVMLRGALLPSMIVSKEIQEYSTKGQITPFALFRINRNENKTAKDMEYMLDLDRSYFKPEDLHEKNWVFADPMNATGGSLVTIVKHLYSQGIVPKSIKTLNVVSAIQGSLQIVRSIENVDVYTMWMDPYLNDLAYILPGLGDAGDRLNGPDGQYNRNIIQLIADYGSTLASLYRSQIREIERTVLIG